VWNQYGTFGTFTDFYGARIGQVIAILCLRHVLCARGSPREAQPPVLGISLMACQLRARATATLARHPSQQAAHHLPCGRPPDFFGPPATPCRPRQQRAFGGRDRQERRQDLRAFVATRSGLDTMPSPAAGAQDAADITEDPPAIHGPEGLVEFRTKLLELQVITRSTPLDPTQLTFISPSYFQSTPYFQSTYSLSASAPGPAFRAAYVTSLRVSTR